MLMHTLNLRLSTILANQLPDLPEGPALENVRGPIEVNEGFESWQVALALLTVLLVVAGLIWLYRRSKKNPAASIDPHTAALAELDAAAQAADDERFAMLCANAVRRYMESCFDLPATSQTSNEIVTQIPLKPQEKSRIQSFLDDCDGVKFAGRPCGKEQRLELLDTGKHLIKTLKGKEAAPSA